jgi:Uma2 family endonuclease
MASTSILFTYDDYVTLPANGKRHEIIEGDLLMTPAPSPDHQRVVVRLSRILDEFVQTHALGEVLVSPVDVVLSMTDVVQPDVVVVSRHRMEIVTKKNIVAAPDLVVEILSESTEKTDRVAKKALYERFGVQEYWIVDPVARAVEVYQLKEGKLSLSSITNADERVASPLFPLLAFPASRLFV